MYGVPHGILRVFNSILYENEFQNPQKNLTGRSLGTRQHIACFITGRSLGRQIVKLFIRP
jgi:hypothetical protein